jgi:hypothetical protein
MTWAAADRLVETLDSAYESQARCSQRHDPAKAAVHTATLARGDYGRGLSAMPDSQSAVYAAPKADTADTIPGGRHTARRIPGDCLQEKERSPPTRKRFVRGRDGTGSTLLLISGQSTSASDAAHSGAEDEEGDENDL